MERLFEQALKGKTVDERKMALLELRRQDLPQVTRLIEQVARQDRNAQVRDLAANLLIQRGVKQRLAESDPAAAAGWPCRFCGGRNPEAAQECGHCGASRRGETATPAGKAEAPARPPFLFDKSNRSLLSGRRKSLMTTGRTLRGLLFMVLPVLIGTLLLVWTMQEWQTYNALQSRGLTANGLCIDRDHSEDSDGDDTYSVTFVFNAGGGRYEVRRNVGYSTYQSCAPNASELDVRYLPENPQVARPLTDMGEPTLMLMVGLGGMGVGAAVSLGLLVNLARKTSLSGQGKLVYGEIVGSELIEARDSDEDTYLLVHYVFKAPDGEVISGERRLAYDSVKRTRPPRGAPMAVMYRSKEHYLVL